MSLCNVNIETGEVYFHAVDFFLRGFIPFRFIRDYESGRSGDSPFGQGWSHNHNHRLLLRGDRAYYLLPDDVEVEVPHPDYPRPQDKEFDLKTKREEDAILLADLGDTVYRFQPLKKGGDLFLIDAHVDPRGNRIEYRYSAAGLLHTVTDTRGRVVTFHSDERRYVSEVTVHHPSEPGNLWKLAQYEYDLAGNLRLYRDRNGAVHAFSYLGHLLTQHVNPLGGKTFFKYDRQGRCVHTHREDGSFERKLTYDPTGGVEIRNSRGAVWRYQLNAQKRPVLEIDPLGRRKEFVYDDKGQLEVTKEEQGSQKVTLYFQDQKKLVSQNGTMTTMVTFDDKMRPIEKVNAAGGKTLFEYDDRSNLVKLIDPMQAEWAFKYEPDGWLNEVTDPRGHHVSRKRTSRWNVEYRDDIGLDGVLCYTPLGLVAGTIDALGNATRYEYGPTDRLTGIHFVDGAMVRFTYDTMGNLTQIKTESGAKTAFEYDQFGAALAVTNPLGHKGAYRYDSEGNLVEVSNFQGEKAIFEYDLMNQIVGVRLFDGRSRFFMYHPQGGVSSVRDERQALIMEIERDEMGRITKKVLPGGWEVTYEWGGQCQLLMAKNPHATLRIEWTDDMRVAAEHVNDFSIFYEYDKLGNRKRLATSTGREIEYSWDPRNRLIKIVDAGRAEYEFLYNEVNVFREWVCPSVVQRYRFDSRLRMVHRSAQHANTGMVIAERNYEYDIQGRLLRMADQHRGAFQYRYSDLEAILSVRGNGYAEDYEYDPNENLIQTRDGSSITYGPGNRMVQGANRTFEHNASGSITNIRQLGQEWRLEYNPEEQLRRVRTPDGHTIEYQYDPLGRRIGKIVNGEMTRFFWDQGTHLAESTADGKTVDYLFLPETFIPLGMTSPAGHFSFILDQAGTPTEMVDASGTVVWSGNYTAFGELYGEGARTVRNPIRFQGQYADDETGFYYNFFRYYYPPCGRYLSQDPLGLLAGANLYRYVLNPFNWVDPFGLNNLVNGVLTIYPICGWSDAQSKDAQKKMNAMNSKVGSKGVTIPNKPVPRCGASAKEIYEDCQQQAKDQGKTPRRDLKEGGGKCENEQADHMLEICAGGGEKDCDNLQPLNESVNKSYGSQVAAAVRQNPGAVLKEVKLAPKSECTDRPSVDC